MGSPGGCAGEFKILGVGLATYGQDLSEDEVDGEGF